MFHDIKGYTTIKNHLLQMVRQDRLPHALLLSSRPGSAALPLVISLITYLHCTQRSPSDDACGRCGPCHKAQKLIHPDIHYLFPIHNTAAQKNQAEKMVLHLAQWRTFVQKNPYGNLQDWQQHVGQEASHSTITKGQIHHIRNVTSKKSLESPYKTILVWLPEQLHPAAANAMLKMIEEPAPKTYFLVVTFNVHRISPTLQSRLWPIHVPPCDDQSLQALLKQHHPTANPTQVAEVVHMAEGNINLALKIMGEDIQSYFDPFSQWMRSLYKQQFGQILHTAETFHAYPSQVQKNWIMYALQMMRYILLSPFCKMEQRHATPQEITFCQKFSQAVKQQAVEEIVQQLSSLHLVLHQHANAKLAFMNASITIATFLKDQ